MDAHEEEMVISALGYIDPSCDYNDWISVGMALHNDGYPFEFWDEWSSMSAEYPGPELLQRHWSSFGRGKGVTVGTIVHLARENGWNADGRYSLGKYGGARHVEKQERHVEFDSDALAILPVPPMLHEVGEDASTDDQIKMYVGNVYRVFDHIMFCRTTRDIGDNVRTTENVVAMAEGGNCGFSAETNGGNGYFVCINPVKPGGSRLKEDVTALRSALIEFDPDVPEGAGWDEVERLKREQLETILKLRLPCSAIVDSGNKSVHAIVRIDAEDAEHYAKRVEYVMDACRAIGAEPDKACRNCNRLTRLPGIRRGEHMQRLIAYDQGFATFDEWYRWVHQYEVGEERDAAGWFVHPMIMDDLPQRSPTLIDGLLRYGHKLILTAPGKAGKTFAMIELAIAVATGGEWLGMRCRQGNVVYIDPEVDPKSWMNRLHDVCVKLGADMSVVRDRVLYYNLRGKAKTLAETVDDVISTFRNGDVSLAIFDSIYRLFDGDENNATQVRSNFAEIDRLNEAVGCAAAMTHHYGKGAKGDVDAKDRGRGSSVFADDPDAPITMIEIFPPAGEAQAYAEDPRRWFRIEDSGLREFPGLGRIDVCFDYPIHKVVTDGLTDGWKPKTMQSIGGANSGESRKEAARENAEKAISALAKHFDDAGIESCSLMEAAKAVEVNRDTLKRYIQSSGPFDCENEGGRVVVRRVR